MLSSSLLLALLPVLATSAVVRAPPKKCPLANCQISNEDTPPPRQGDDESGYHYDYSLVETSSKKSASKAKTKGCGQTFTPAHFTCTSCDVSSCKGCNNVVCDLAKCIGKFYKQECWCSKPVAPDIVSDKFFCDDDCTGGMCNTGGLKCKRREDACKPWWWCKLPPPKEPQEPSFLQFRANTQQGACAKRESSTALNAKLQAARAQIQAGASSQQQSGGIKRQIEDFSFGTGSWSCDSAVLPEPDEDPVTLQQYAAGFIVLDGNTCSGGFFKKQCFCYDKFLWLRGKDPMVSELTCDDGCGQGPCSGKTCGKQPPPPLPASAPPPPLDPMLQELANEGMLRNYGTQMSPVT